MFCKDCGAQISDSATMCPKCGCTIKNINQEKSITGLQLTAKILMIFSCIISAIAIIPLAWIIPMITSYSDKIKRGESVSFGFKACTFLFVNFLAGILMFCDND